MLGVVDRTITTFTWAALVAVTLVVAGTSHLPARATILIIALELAGLIIILLATRGRCYSRER